MCKSYRFIPSSEAMAARVYPTTTLSTLRFKSGYCYPLIFAAQTTVKVISGRIRAAQATCLFVVEVYFPPPSSDSVLLLLLLLLLLFLTVPLHSTRV